MKTTATNVNIEIQIDQQFIYYSTFQLLPGSRTTLYRSYRISKFSTVLFSLLLMLGEAVMKMHYLMNRPKQRNSSYGYQKKDISKHTMTEYLGDEKTHKAIKSRFLKNQLYGILYTTVLQVANVGAVF